METNNLICEVFDKLRQVRLDEKKHWNASAYKKAIISIKNYPDPITSGNQVIQLPNVGKRMAERIDEIIATGTVKELENFDSSKVEVIELFQTIHDVGIKTATDWYNLGYRKISDIPLDHCTRNQRIGIELHSDLIQRIPRAEVELIEQKIREFLEPRNIQFEICGSYRRGRPDCGDVDIMVIDQPNRDIKMEVIECPIFTHQLSHGPKKFMGVGKVDQLHRRIDVELVQPNEYPYAIVYFTGPGSFNTKMREYCLQHGLRLNEKGLTNLTTGETYPAKNEGHVFQMLGLQYLTPQERDRY